MIVLLQPSFGSSLAGIRSWAVNPGDYPQPARITLDLPIFPGLPKIALATRSCAILPCSSGSADRNKPQSGSFSVKSG